SPGDGWEDGDDVAVGHLGLELVEVPDVVVVAVHVDELVDAARLVDQLVGKTRVASSQIGEHVAHGGAGGGHRRGPVRVRPQARGKTNLDGHGTSVQVRPDGSGFLSAVEHHLTLGDLAVADPVRAQHRVAVPQAHDHVDPL